MKNPQKPKEVQLCLAFNVMTFCESHGISRSLFYGLVSQGRGPRLMKVGKRTLISAEAAAEWRARMEKQTLEPRDPKPRDRGPDE